MVEKEDLSQLSLRSTVSLITPEQESILVSEVAECIMVSRIARANLKPEGAMPH